MKNLLVILLISISIVSCKYHNAKKVDFCGYSMGEDIHDVWAIADGETTYSPWEKDQPLVVLSGSLSMYKTVFGFRASVSLTFDRTDDGLIDGHCLFFTNTKNKDSLNDNFIHIRDELISQYGKPIKIEIDNTTRPYINGLNRPELASYNNEYKLIWEVFDTIITLEVFGKTEPIITMECRLQKF